MTNRFEVTFAAILELGDSGLRSFWWLSSQLTQLTSILFLINYVKVRLLISSSLAH